MKVLTVVCVLAMMMVGVCEAKSKPGLMLTFTGQDIAGAEFVVQGIQPVISEDKEVTISSTGMISGAKMEANGINMMVIDGHSLDNKTVFIPGHKSGQLFIRVILYNSMGDVVNGEVKTDWVD